MKCGPNELFDVVWHGGYNWETNERRK